MPTRGIFDLRGLDAYLQEIAQAGIDVDEAVAEAVEESGDVLVDEMDRLVPRDEGNLANNLGRTEAQRDGNFTFIEVGLIGAGGFLPDKDTARYGNAQEFGYQRGGRFHPPQAYVRPSFDRKKAAVRRKQRESLKAKGFVD